MAALVQADQHVRGRVHRRVPVAPGGEYLAPSLCCSLARHRHIRPRMAAAFRYNERLDLGEPPPMNQRGELRRLTLLPASDSIHKLLPSGLAFADFSYK